MINTIIFDLGGVYFDGHKNIANVLSDKYGIPLDSAGVIWKSDEIEALYKGELTEEEFWNLMKAKNKWNISVDMLKESMRSVFVEIPGTRQIIEKLYQRGYTLGILSIHVREWVVFLNNKFDYHKLFHTKLYSFDTALHKPHTEAYQAILQQLNAKPSSTIFIDDKEKNIVPARALGIQGVQFMNANQLEEDLEKLGVALY